MKASNAVKTSESVATEYLAGERNVNLPNVLTVSRILLIPIFIFAFWSPTPMRSVVAAAVFLVAALTDLLDGYLARRRGQITNLGRLLDPIADKLLILSGLVLLVQFDRVAAWLAIVIVAREIAVTVVRGLAAADGIILSAELAGKYKMTSQVIGILLLILEGSVAPLGWNPHLLGTALLYLSLVLGLVSGGQCVVSYWRQLSLRSA